jgi:hypothetical protein
MQRSGLWKKVFAAVLGLLLGGFFSFNEVMLRAEEVMAMACTLL